jgi:hypothetical protein
MSKKRWILFVLLTVLSALLEGLLMADPNAVMKLLRLK